MCDDKYARIYGGALNTSHQPTTAGQSGRPAGSQLAAAGREGRPPAAEGGRVVVAEQRLARQGTASKPAKPRQST